MVAQGLGSSLQALVGQNPTTAKNLFLGAVGVGSQLKMLSFGRKQESEADRLGLIFMAMAGYDPRGARGVLGADGRPEPGRPARIPLRLTPPTRPASRTSRTSCRKRGSITSRAEPCVKKGGGPSDVFGRGRWLSGADASRRALIQLTPDAKRKASLTAPPYRAHRTCRCSLAARWPRAAAGARGASFPARRG